MVRSLRYHCNIKPDIAYGMELVSIFMENKKRSHLLATKRILRYVKGTCDVCYSLITLVAETRKSLFFHIMIGVVIKVTKGAH